MTFDDIVDLAEKAGCDVSAIDGREYQTMWCDYYQLERFAAALIQAGAASRDAEVARLKTVPMRYRRMAFNAQLQDEVARLEQENDQLRAQINVLRESLSKMHDTYFKTDEDEELCKRALASTPEQSLAAYRNKVIEDCAKRAETYAYMSQNFNALAEELRAMKEQP